ncbi:unnamed protein product [Polarella glacialis]|uniref:Response regulatory domain-containing protein n=2 Tax=Polarella glacialis TaxID=89957 RepID=A0A813JM23_POLGL|nr:unnamed protein product [Polarella glacialis]|mmetsp:Transcript_15392/g.24560  ORF Transcript_15392/g.24560 Transcript_15392/m.24560 type:complete len:309 (-) Transcript_15392:109-1035(-)|eukprot:CAMPEP_0115070152 /NCGR_PEP_ID=MMETSP0227-20121206/12953_1 /TAXON_ID=89957 /ORGANISM="Polarella glacialis, Strain CCMP 1383" /LENGTH=308 /DNA_ID=CAMNT_0002456631 /DNA_START=87 /DNA_END=1013 /DNA_ORIENTATION=-
MVNFQQIEVILAEDEEMFREMALPNIIEAGIAEDKIHIAEDGQEAIAHLDRLQAQAAPGTVIVMLLDVRMPVMDGNKCAQTVQESVASGSRAACPFMICCSANIREVAETSSGDFHMTMPKSFSPSSVAYCMTMAFNWCKANSPSSSPGVAEKSISAASGSSATTRTSTNNSDTAPRTSTEDYDGSIDVIVADREPICRMALVANMPSTGTEDEPVETEDEDETMDALRHAQDINPGRPILLLLGVPGWLPLVQKLNLTTRKPFICVISVDGREYPGYATLPGSYTKVDILEMLGRTREWWKKGCLES